MEVGGWISRIILRFVVHPFSFLRYLIKNNQNKAKSPSVSSCSASKKPAPFLLSLSPLLFPFSRLSSFFFNEFADPSFEIRYRNVSSRLGKLSSLEYIIACPFIDFLSAGICSTPRRCQQGMKNRERRKRNRGEAVDKRDWWATVAIGSNFGAIFSRGGTRRRNPTPLRPPYIGLSNPVSSNPPPPPLSPSILFN